MIILAGAIIITLSNSNIMDNANKSKFLNTYKTLEEALTIKKAGIYLSNINTSAQEIALITIDSLDVSLNKADADKFTIEDGKIVLTELASDKEKAWIQEYEQENKGQQEEEPDDVIYISTAAELRNIENNPDGYYKLKNNIDISMEAWDAIAFLSGTLDGNGYSIKVKELNITRLKLNTGDFALVTGLVGQLTGVIKNIKTIADSNIIITNTNNYALSDYANVNSSIIATYNIEGTIKNCYNTGSISSPANEESLKAGIVSLINESTILQHNYYLEGTAETGAGGTADSVNLVEPKTEAQMKHSSFVDLLNTEQSELHWKYISNSYPRLIWQK